MRKWELIKQSKLMKIKGKILSNLFIEKYGLEFGEFNIELRLIVFPQKRQCTSNYKRSVVVRVSKLSSIFPLNWKINFLQNCSKDWLFTNWKLYENSIFHFSIFLVNIRNAKLRNWGIFWFSNCLWAQCLM